jgi:hypothetical protein
MIMKALVGFAVILFATNAFAQGDAPPKVGNRPLVQVKQQAPMGCKLVGTVKGTKLWAGDCIGAAELRDAAPPTAESASPPPAAAAPTDKQ